MLQQRLEGGARALAALHLVLAGEDLDAAPAERLDAGEQAGELPRLHRHGANSPRLDPAAAAYRKALELEPNNAIVAKSLLNCEQLLRDNAPTSSAAAAATSAPAAPPAPPPPAMPPQAAAVEEI